MDKLFGGPVAANDNTERLCRMCGSAVTGHHLKKFCCAKCRRANEHLNRDYDRERARFEQLAPERICEHCGASFKRRKDSHNAARFCSRQCGFDAGSNVWMAPRIDAALLDMAKSRTVSFQSASVLCKECGSRFTCEDIRTGYCSLECRRLSFWRRKGVDPTPRKCPECDIVFAVVYGRGQALFCSQQCSSRHNARKSKWRRKARMKAVANDNINPFYVFDRDGWRCKMCGVNTPKKLRGTHDDRAPELDHIMPISLGGSHTLDNVQCSCRKCNGLKSNKPMGQTLLFG